MLVELARFNTRVEADLARLLLEAEMVDAVLFDEGMNNFYGGVLMPVRLMVLDDDHELAARILAAEGVGGS